MQAVHDVCLTGFCFVFTVADPGGGSLLNGGRLLTIKNSKIWCHATVVYLGRTSAHDIISRAYENIISP